MIDAKRWLTARSPRLVICLAVFAAFTDAGCSSITGFRSVGTDRPSLLGRWDRSTSSAGTPTPEQDSYVLSMRGSQASNTALAQRAARDAKAQANGRDAGGELLAGPANPTPPASAGTAPIAAQDSIRVTLGRPEPLPGLVKASGSAAGASIAANATSSPWKPEGIGEPAPEAEAPSPRSELASRDAASAGSVPSDAPARPAADDEWKSILTRAADHMEALRTYQVNLSRTERVNGQLQPEEQILLSIRRDPKAVRLEWSTGPNKGREVIYSSTVDARMLFVHMAATAIPLPVMRIPVDSPLVMRNSRHAITEAGLGTIIENLRKAERSGPGNQASTSGLSYHGTRKPDGLDRECHYFVNKTPSGETWNVYLDQKSFLPRMVFAQDSKGDMIERYIYGDVRENPTELTVAGAFEPDQRWGQNKGLLGRIARAAAGNDLPSSSASTTR